MNELGKITDKMVQRGVEEAVLVGDKPMRLLTQDGREAAGPTISSQQLLDLVKEAAPSHLLPQLAADGKFSFLYQSPHKPFKINGEQNNGQLQITIAPVIKSIPVTVPAAPNKKTVYLSAAGVAGLLLIIAGAALFGRQTKLNEDKAKATQVQQEGEEREALSNDSYGRYSAEINQLSKIGVTVRTIGDDPNFSFKIAKEDITPYNAAIESLKKRISADKTVEGSEKSGQKAELFNALHEATIPSSKFHPYARAAAINRETERNLNTHLRATGEKALSNSVVQQTIIAMKGFDAYLKLGSADDFNTEVEKLFPA